MIAPDSAHAQGRPKKGAKATPAKRPKAPAKTDKTPAKTDKADKADRDEPSAPSEPTGAPIGELRGPTRIDFDDRLIQGQTNKSGAVYLFDRKETGISSMVKRRKSFKQLTVETVFDR